MRLNLLLLPSRAVPGRHCGAASILALGAILSVVGGCRAPSTPPADAGSARPVSRDLDSAGKRANGVQVSASPVTADFANTGSRSGAEATPLGGSATHAAAHRYPHTAVLPLEATDEDLPVEDEFLPHVQENSTMEVARRVHTEASTPLPPEELEARIREAEFLKRLQGEEVFEMTVGWPSKD